MRNDKRKKRDWTNEFGRVKGCNLICQVAKIVASPGLLEWGFIRDFPFDFKLITDLIQCIARNGSLLASTHTYIIRFRSFDIIEHRFKRHFDIAIPI